MAYDLINSFNLRYEREGTRGYTHNKILHLSKGLLIHSEN